MMTELGLLVLRITLAAVVLRVGIGQALDFDATARLLADDGWRKSVFVAYLITATQIVGGAALVIGMLTPLAAAGVAAVTASAWLDTLSASDFWANPFPAPFLAAGAAIALLCAGAGEYSVDARVFDRPTWSVPISVSALVVAVAAATAAWMGLHGAPTAR